jgi:hypothetical protein
MKKIILRLVLTVLILVCLRLIYVKVVNVPFFEQVFISTSIGFIFSQIVLELVLNKLKINNRL